MISALAPGKAMLCGEYAVLEGAPAVVAALARHARARLLPPPARAGRASRFIEQARAAALAYLESQQRVPPAGEIEVDTRALAAPPQGSRPAAKLGLGSSAATTVATAALLLASAGCDLGQAAVREALGALADTAHRAAQSGHGSGADVAASVWGGIQQFTRPAQGPAVRAPLELPAKVSLTFVWTGEPASTRELVQTVLAKRPMRELGRLTELAHAFIAACAAGDAGALLETAERYGEGLGALGQASGCPILTPAHVHVRALARAHRGAAKPSGAGGGDLAVAFFTDDDQAAAFRLDAGRQGLLPLHLPIDWQGAHTES